MFKNVCVMSFLVIIISVKSAKHACYVLICSISHQFEIHFVSALLTMTTLLNTFPNSFHYLLNLQL